MTVSLLTDELEVVFKQIVQGRIPDYSKHGRHLEYLPQRSWRELLKAGIVPPSVNPITRLNMFGGWPGLAEAFVSTGQFAWRRPGKRTGPSLEKVLTRLGNMARDWEDWLVCSRA